MKKVLFTLAIGLATLTSCESDSDSNNSNSNEVVLITQSVDTYADGSTTTVNYTYDGNKLVGTDASDGYEDTYTYTGGLLTKIEDTHGAPDEVDVSVLEYDSSDRLIKETVNYDDGLEVVVNTFVYNTDGTVTKNHGSEDVTSVYTIVSGNLTKTVYTDSNAGESSVTTVTYDNNNQPFKNIANADTFLLLGYSAFTNNQLSVTVTGSASYPEDNSNTVYNTFNSDDYPSKSTTTYMSGTVDEETQTTEYFYN